MISITAWIRLDESGADQGIAAKYADSDGFQLFANYGAIVWKTDTTTVTTADSLCSIDEWYHIAVSHDGNHVARLYIDGELKKEGQASAYSCYGHNFVVGRKTSDTDADYFPGDIDDIRVYSTALSAAQIQDLFRTGGKSTPSQNEIDGDILIIDWDPDNTTPEVVPETTNTDHLSSHLKGIDVVMGSLKTWKETGWSGSFTNGDGDMVTVVNGLITDVS